MFDDLFLNLEKEEKQENTKKIKIADNGVYILSDELKKQIDKKKLSPSMISGWLASPGDWIMDSFIMGEVQIEETPHLRRGNWFHSIMEDFFHKEPEKRDFAELKESINRVSKETYPDMLENQDHKDWLQKAIKGYAKTWLGNAKNEKIAVLFDMGQKKEGLEYFATGKIGKCERLCLGFVDRIIEGENGLIVQDWKTGAKISNFDPTKKISESNPFDYWRQQTFYTLLLEQKGAVVESASLVFPCSEPPQIVEVNIKMPAVRQQVINDCEKVDKELTEAINNNYFFPFKKGKYNKWASYLCGMGNAYPPKIHQDKLLMLAEIE